MQYKFPQQQIVDKRGFTLVEMLVSLSLFAMVITMSVSMLLVLIDANGRAQSMQLVMTNVSFALDSMTREIRTGTDWYCNTYTGSNKPNVSDEGEINDCLNGGNYITITESGDSLTSGKENNRITYWFHADSDGNGLGTLKRCLGYGSDCNNNDEWIPLTGKDIDIEEFEIVVEGTDKSSSADWKQPTLTMYIRGLAGSGNQVQEKGFSLQTSVTQRILDI